MPALSISRPVNPSRHRPEIKIIEGGDDKIVPNDEASAVVLRTNKESGDHTENQTSETAVGIVNSKSSCLRMTKEALVKVCKELKLYTTPSLNDVLYLNHRGYPRIENLHAYTGLRCLFLGSNGLQKIENLDQQAELRSLFLQQNLISKIENLENLTKLANLSLTGNKIQRIENLGEVVTPCLPELCSVELSHNALNSLEDVSHLCDCQSIEILDLSHNKLDNPAIVDVFAKMGNLGVLCLTGNPVISKVPNYRKTMICKIKTLNHLDQCPVFPRDRACAEAWYTGGREAEMNERQAWMDKHQKDMTDSLQHLSNLRKSAQEAKETVEMMVQAVLKQEELTDTATSQNLMETYEEVRLSPSFDSLSISMEPAPPIPPPSFTVDCDNELNDIKDPDNVEALEAAAYTDKEAETPFLTRQNGVDYQMCQPTYEDGIFGHDRGKCTEDLEKLPDTVTSSLLMNREGLEPVGSSRLPFALDLPNPPVYPSRRKPLIEILPDDT